MNNYNEKTKTFSSNFEYAKVYREEIEKVNELKSKYSCPASDFIALLSKAVCENVDIYGVCSKIKSPNCFLSTKRLLETLGTTKYKKAIEKLNILKNVFNAIDYEEVNTPGYHTFYIKFNICSSKIKEGIYEPTRVNPANLETQFTHKGKAAYATTLNTGFFFVNKEEFLSTFFSNNFSHGIKDLYWIFKMNCSYDESPFKNSEVKNKYLVKWGNTVFDGITASNYYNTYNNLSKIMNISVLNIKRFMNRLVINELIEKKYWRNKGTIILLKFVSELKYDEYCNSNYEEKNAFDKVIEYLKTYFTNNKATIFFKDCKKYNENMMFYEGNKDSYELLLA